MQVNNRALIRAFRDSEQKEPLRLDAMPLSAALKASILSVDAKAMRIRTRFEPGEQFLHGRGVIQGGILATMLDFTIAFICMAVTAEDKAVAAANLNVGYLKPGLAGVYFCEAEIERAGRSLIFARASLMPEKGDTVATATAVMSVINVL